MKPFCALSKQISFKKLVPCRAHSSAKISVSTQVHFVTSCHSFFWSLEHHIQKVCFYQDETTNQDVLIKANRRQVAFAVTLLMPFLCRFTIPWIDYVYIKHDQSCSYIHTHLYYKKLINSILCIGIFVRTYYTHICA